MNVVMIGPFGFKKKATMRQRALPMAKALVRRGHQVTIIVPPWDSPEDAGSNWLDEGVRVINTLLPRVKGPRYYLQLAAWLSRLALQRQPDVIHFFKPKAFAGLAHLLLRLLRRLKRHHAKLVVDEDDWETAWNEVNNYSLLQKRFFAWQEPWGLTHADSVTVASRALYGLTEHLQVPRDKIFYVPNGTRPINSPHTLLKSLPIWQAELSTIIETDESLPQSGLEPPRPLHHHYYSAAADYGNKIRAQYDLFGKPVILLYTRFVEFHLNFLLDVIYRVSFFAPEARWLIVGQGYFEEEDRLKLIAREDNLINKLIFTGLVPWEDLPDYFAAANVAIHPYDDTLVNRTKCSVKLLDLLAAGVPVVASRVGQNAEYIVHGKTGILVPPQDATKMAEAVVLLLNNQQAQQRLGQEASRYVKRVFQWDILVEEVEAAYQHAEPEI